MRINPLVGKVVNPYTKVNPASVADKFNMFAQNDSFEISENAQTISVALQQSKSDINQAMENIDAGKISRIQNQIKNGQYRIDSMSIAASMMNIEEK